MIDWAKQIRRRYTDKAIQEWERLSSTPITRIERLINTYCLERYLPATGRILDAGSGPGRYAIAMARQGYQVVTFDLVAEMLHLGQSKIAEAGVSGNVAATQGNLIALPYADDVFDAAINLGAPLSHITDGGARLAVVGELVRVVRPGGIVFLTGLQRLAGYRSAVYWMDEDYFDQMMTPVQRARGIYDGSQVWYNFAPDELQNLVLDAGLQIVDCVGCQGLANHLPIDHLERLETDPERWVVWKALLLETCNEPSIVGISNHLLVVARKP
ncbi:MAG: methyltransferase domain-containing protein [Anaerolineae bacterium]|nr:methyltransferase domain-containing protein [Anaerolineae bacterium]